MAKSGGYQSLYCFDDEEDEKSCYIEQFVKNVPCCSSQYGNDTNVSYTAFNLQGPPSNYPNYGDFPQSFVMRTYGTWWDECPSKQEDFMKQNNPKVVGHDFVEVEFETPCIPEQINIYETFTPGAVVRIWAYSGHYWALLWEGSPKPNISTSRIFSPRLRRILFATKTLRIEFNHSLLSYYTEIDAILLKGKRLPSSCYKLASTSVGSPCKSIEKGGILDKIIAAKLHKAVSLPRAKEQVTGDANVSPAHTLTSLPEEVVLKIFMFLDLRSVLACARVNVYLNRMAIDPILYKSLNFKPYWHCVNTEFIMSLQKRCDYLEKVDLSWCGSQGMITSDGFINFLKCCNDRLKHIRLDACDFATDRVLTAMVLELPYINEISLASCLNIHDFLPLAVLTKLTRLNLYRTQVNNSELLAIIYANPSLRHVNLGSCTAIESMDELVIVLSANCPKLISINLWKCNTLTPMGMMALGRCKDLEEVDVGWCLQISGSGEWLSAFFQCKKMKRFNLEAIRGLGDEELEELVKYMPDIEQLGLLGMRGLSVDACTGILETCQNLKMIDLSFCDQITEEHVRMWSRRFYNVSIKRSFQKRPESPPLNPNVRLADNDL